MSETPVPTFHPSRLLLLITRPADSDVLVVESPHLPGWRAAARGPRGLLTAVEQAWTETRCRAYGDARGQAYASPDVNPDTPRANGAWQELPDGRWLSPAGRVYGADTAAARRQQVSG